MFKIPVLKLSFLLLLTYAGSVSANQSKHFTQDDYPSVEAAVEDIRATLETQRFSIDAIINHAAAAESVGLQLRPTTVIFAGHSFFEYVLIRRSQLAALDIPFKFLAFEDETGKIRVEINDEGYLVDRHRIPLRDRLINRLDRAINQFGRLENGIIEIESKQSVDDTVSALLTRLEELGFRIPIPGGIDFQDRAHRKGLRLRPTRLIVFGNPLVGSPLMEIDQSIGIDLPQKMLVYEMKKDKVFIAFNDPAFLAKRHGLQKNAELETRLENIRNALTGIATVAATP